jgi:hypothetical protein
MSGWKSFFKPNRKKIIFTIIYFLMGWFLARSFASMDCIGGCPKTYYVLFHFMPVLEFFRIIPRVDFGYSGYTFVIMLVLTLAYSYLISCIIS